MEANNDDDDDEAAAVAASNAANLKLMSILEDRDDFPLRQRTKINELTKEYLTKLENDIHAMLCDKTNCIGNNYYHGLDSDRDTVAEVKTAIGFFPEVLARRKQTTGDDDDQGNYPVHYVIHYKSVNLNLKAVSFLPVLVQLAIKFNQFAEEERGGLLVRNTYGDNALQLLLYNFGSDHNELTDIRLLAVLLQLRQMSLFKKQDIFEQDLVSQCQHFGDCCGSRFRFLVYMEPNLLLRADEHYGSLPLHHAPYYSIQTFQLIFEYGIRFYPNKKGICILFLKDNNGRTPFSNACDSFTKVEVMKIIEDILARYSETTPINVEEALVSAVIDDKLHLDRNHNHR